MTASPQQALQQQQQSPANITPPSPLSQQQQRRTPPSVAATTPGGGVHPQRLIQQHHPPPPPPSQQQVQMLRHPQTQQYIQYARPQPPPPPSSIAAAGYAGSPSAGGAPQVMQVRHHISVSAKINSHCGTIRSLSHFIHQNNLEVPQQPQQQYSRQPPVVSVMRPQQQQPQVRYAYIQHPSAVVSSSGEPASMGGSQPSEISEREPIIKEQFYLKRNYKF